MFEHGLSTMDHKLVLHRIGCSWVFGTIPKFMYCSFMLRIWRFTW